MSDKIHNKHECPNCDNVGWYAVRDPEGVWEQEQCEFCYTMPESVFNLKDRIKQLEAELDYLRKHSPEAVAILDNRITPAMSAFTEEEIWVHDDRTEWVQVETAEDRIADLKAKRLMELGEIDELSEKGLQLSDFGKHRILTEIQARIIQMKAAMKEDGDDGDN